MPMPRPRPKAKGRFSSLGGDGGGVGGLGGRGGGGDGGMLWMVTTSSTVHVKFTGMSDNDDMNITKLLMLPSLATHVPVARDWAMPRLKAGTLRLLAVVTLSTVSSQGLLFNDSELQYKAGDMVVAARSPATCMHGP